MIECLEKIEIQWIHNRSLIEIIGDSNNIYFSLNHFFRNLKLINVEFEIKILVIAIA